MTEAKSSKRKKKKEPSCPFCGSPHVSLKSGARHEVTGEYRMGVVYAYAKCESCGARGPVNETRTFDGRTDISDESRKRIGERAMFFFQHGYLDIEDTNEWFLYKHGKAIRKDGGDDLPE